MHLASDRLFFDELIARCQEAGIPIRARPEEMSGLLYALVLGIVPENDWGASSFGGAIDVLLELVAAFCLGEVVLQVPNPISPTPQPEEGYRQ